MNPLAGFHDIRQAFIAPVEHDDDLKIDRNRCQQALEAFTKHLQSTMVNNYGVNRLHHCFASKTFSSLSFRK